MRSSEFVHSYQDQVDNDDNENYAQFLVNFNEVRAFHSNFRRDVPDPSAKYEGAILANMLAPILTRWWTVGLAASCTFDYYLQLFHVTQTTINIYSSVSRANKIASALYSLMLDQENFIDLSLIRSFHKRYVNKHLDWLQLSDDLTEALGFQAHNMAVRYYIMDYDHRNILTGRSMPDYLEAVDKAPREDSKWHMDKLKTFVSSSHANLHKHFSRWVGYSLLPVALMSESSTAKVVAAVMLGLPMPTDAELGDVVYCQGSQNTYFHSNVNSDCGRINMKGLYKFLQEKFQQNDDDTFIPMALYATHLLRNDNDLRNKECDLEASVHGEFYLSYTALTCHLHVKQNS